MRWLYAVFLVMMLGFVAVQYNDPDGPLWMLLYGAVAVWCAIALWRPGMLRGTPVLLGLAAASIAVYRARLPLGDPRPTTPISSAGR